MRPRTAITTTIALLLVATRGALAQCNGGATCTLPISATATINTVARLMISSTTTTLTAPNAADFGTSAGVTSGGPTITVLSNAAYTLTAAASATTWTGPSGVSKPASDLKMKVGAGSVVPLGQVGTSSTGTATTDYAISYNTIYNWTTDKPGTYSLVVNYTLTAP
jgi:hypothetical protein